ncbi:MAG: peptidoglycan synthetase [Cyclobacteriaceae bacterium]|nr:MAG: peptidoglycan synthetase [Cyclobacteriaceae bacterium]
MLAKNSKVHFIAIGGSVMHSLALALHQAGIIVTGSDDMIFEPSKSRLAAHGLLPQTIGWKPERVHKDLDAVILGMHAKGDNPELARARELNLPVFSYPEFIYQQSKDKQRIVIAGSHGKTTITSMIIHVLNHWKRSFDFVVGAHLDGFENTVKLSDAPIIIIEGDEYLTSTLDKTPKFLKYHHHIGLVSGVAWDHINVFPTIDEYVKQFDLFADATPKAGGLVYCEEDDLATVICGKQRTDVASIPYQEHPSTISNGNTYLITDHGKVSVKVFGKHNMQNFSGAKMVLDKIGITEEQFYQAIPTFKGARNRLELVNKSNQTVIFKDYAHAPSKLAATTKALKEQFPDRKLVACIELHTYSSLNKKFLSQYSDSFESADLPIVYYNPEIIAHKNLEPISKKEVKAAFNRDDLMVFDDINELEHFLLKQDWKGKNLLMMSSGNYHNLSIKVLSDAILEGSDN